MTESLKLFRVTIVANHSEFYVVATTETGAAKLVYDKWKEWKYIGEPTATKIERLAENVQYPKGGDHLVGGTVAWLLLE